MNILAIETSCDETAAAIVADGTKELASVIASSKELHEATGGVVPEIAARKQMEFMVPVLDQTIKKFSQATGIEESQVKNHVDAIAVTVGPGLVGSLLVGVDAAKALALAWNKPLIPVNHLVGHIYANFLEQSNNGAIEFPVVVLIVSGGHTDLVLMKGHGDFEYLGGTLDDAAGEAFDKTARLLGLSKYLGGAQLSKLAASCTLNLARGVLPRPMIHSNNYDFSFSGLKTAVKNLIDSNVYSADSVANEFENAVVDVLVEKTVKAAKEYGAKQILMGGGVSANKFLRSRLIQRANDFNIQTCIPPFELCTDNAVYIASAAYFIQKSKQLSEIKANPSLGIMDVA